MSVLASRPRRVVAVLLALLLGQLVLAFVVYRDVAPPPIEEMEPIAGVGGLSAELCRTCHAAIYDEWAQSGHARAFVDPLYRAELAHQVVTFPCERCHTPLVEQQPTRVLGLALAWPTLVPFELANGRFDPALQREGVTCVACHLVGEELVGPFDDATAPHPSARAELGDPAMCARCHQLDFAVVGRLDRPILDTVREWQAFAASGGRERCVDCHMPAVDPRPAALRGPVRRGTDHRLHGPFDASFVTARVRVDDVELDVARDRGAVARLSLANGSGHRVPSAEPERSIVVELAALAADGVALAQTTTRIERPIDVARLRSQGADTTLEVGELRALVLELPAPLPEDAVELALTVDFVLWDPAAAVLAELPATQPAAHRLFERRMGLVSAVRDLARVPGPRDRDR
jgi:hypothetical protein